MSRIVLVHGFNVRDGGARTIDRLAPFLEGKGHIVDCDGKADYGWMGLLGVRFNNKHAVERIADALLHADAVVTHSNGANFTEQALDLIQKDMPVFHLSPALDRDFWLNNPRKTHIFYTRSDKAVWFSRWLILHPWGDMGRVGYRGKQAGVTNHDFSFWVNGHSGWFKQSTPRFFAYKIDKILRRQYESN